MLLNNSYITQSLKIPMEMFGICNLNISWMEEKSIFRHCCGPQVLRAVGSGAVVWPTCIISTLKLPALVGGLVSAARLWHRSWRWTGVFLCLLRTVFKIVLMAWIWCSCLQPDAKFKTVENEKWLWEKTDACEVVLKAHIGYTVKNIKDLLQCVYFDVAY